jgi:hypothetical protein
MITGNEVILSPMVIWSSASDSVPEGILLIIQRFFDLYLRLTTKCLLLFLMYCVLEWCVKWKWFCVPVRRS